MKKFLSIVLAAVMVCLSCVSLFSCASTGTNADYTVGILQQMEHVALDSANEGFRTELTRLMSEAGKTVEFNDKNANGDITTMSTIASTLVNAK